MAVEQGGILMDAGATVAAMNMIQHTLDSDYRGKVSKVGHDILVSALGHLRRSLREYLTRGGK